MFAMAGSRPSSPTASTILLSALFLLPAVSILVSCGYFDPLDSGVPSHTATTWQKTFGGSGEDAAMAVQKTADGGFILAGYTDAPGNFDVWLIKTGAAGNEEWSKTFGETQAEGDSVRQTAEGGYIIGGTNQEDAFLLRTDASGNKQWSRRFGTEFPDYGNFALQTRDGGYVLVGSTRSGLSGDFNAWLIKTDASGNEQWSWSYGGSAWDRADWVQQTVDGGYVIVGMTRSFGPWEQVWLLKTDASGELQWSTSFGGNGNERGLSVQQTADGGYVIAGYTDSFGAGDRDAYLIYYKR